jgi:hypothetical protein
MAPIVAEKLLLTTQRERITRATTPTSMDYAYENLGPNRFQEFAQALLIREYPNIQCLPVGQRDGGRDALSNLRHRRSEGYVAFQVKFAGREKDPHKWLVDVMSKELPKINQLIRNGAQEYILLTNVAGTAFPQAGSIDRLQALLDAEISVPSQCWWRDDLNRRLENDPLALKWSFPELLTGQDVLRVLVEAGLSDQRERRVNAIRAFARAQYEADRKVRFRQIDLDSELTDLFVDVPLTLQPRTSRDSYPDQVALRRVWKLDPATRVLGRDSFGPPFRYHTGDPDEALAVGGASFLLDSEVQKHYPLLVIEGAPGQGKSTLAQYVCQLYRARLLGEPASQGIPSNHLEGPLRLPIRVDLRHFAAWLSGQDPFTAESALPIAERTEPSLEAFLAALIRHESGGADFSVSDLQAVATQSALLLVLDGLDEVADMALRRTVVQVAQVGIERLATLCVSLQAVVTSRPAAFANSPGFSRSRFRYALLTALRRDLIDSYANKWIRARALPSAEAEEVRTLVRERLGLPHIRELARNPMQLAILLGVIHSRGASLPDKRTQLYDNYVSLFFDRESEKSPLIREHRELLVELHGYLAWRLHGDAERGDTRGSISDAALRALLREYLVLEGRDPDLVERLFQGMVERVVALVSRVEGTYEFEVQPLREYFAGVYLYHTKKYSPAAIAKRGDLIDRFNALARNFYWLNVARFYAGCVDRGELPALVQCLDDLCTEQGYRATSHPKTLAAMLLSDWVFSQSPRDAREVINLLLSEKGLHYPLHYDEFLPSGSKPALHGSDRDVLIEEAFSRLRTGVDRGRARILVDLINENATSEEALEKWLHGLSRASSRAKDAWIEYGQRLDVIRSLSSEQLAIVLKEARTESLVDGVLQDVRYSQLHDRPQLTDKCVQLALDDIAALTSPRRAGEDILSAFRLAVSPWPYVFARKYAPAPTLGKALERLTGSKPDVTALAENAVGDPIAKACLDVVRAFRDLSFTTTEVLETSLEPWNSFIESVRDRWGTRWALVSLANLAAGIRSRTERGAGYEDLFDERRELAPRLRYARMRAGQVEWWKRTLGRASDEFETAIALSVLLTWGSSGTIAPLIPSLASLVEPLSDKNFTAMCEVVRTGFEVTGEEITLKELESSQIKALGKSTTPRAATLLAICAGGPLLETLYSEHVGNARPSAVPDVLLRPLVQRCLAKRLQRGDVDWDDYVEIARRSYVADVELEPEFLVPLIRPGRRRGRQRFSAVMGERVCEQSDQYPRELVETAERISRETIAKRITPVADTAEAEGWFT